VGCDLRPGPGVDRIEDLACLQLADGAAGTVICVDTLEHVFEARRAADELIRVLAPAGTLLVAAPMDFRIHEHPGDYWRLTPACLARLLSPLPAVLTGWQGVESYPHTVFGIGFKAPVPEALVGLTTHFLSRFDSRLRQARAAIPLGSKLKQWCRHWLRSRGERRKWAEHFRTGFSLRASFQTSELEVTAPARSAGCRPQRIVT
jgi:SAM-dependent methyltransferase